MANPSLGHRAPLLWLVLPFLAGLAWGRTAAMPSSGLALTAAAGALAVAGWTAGRNVPAWGGAILLAMALAGAASYRLHRPRLADWPALPPREARLQLRVVRTFATDQPGRTSGLAVVTDADAHLNELVGQRVYFALRSAPDGPPLIRSAEISALGVLVSLPAAPAAGGFEGYLDDAGINFLFTRGRVQELVRPPTGFRRFCARQADRLAAILAIGLGTRRPELTHVYQAMMLGRRDELSDEQDALFMHSGTMHLFAISGLHVGMIALGLGTLLAWLRLPAALRLGAVVTGLWVYVEITGEAPSAVRACIMITLFHAARAIRAPGNPIATLAASALVVMLVDPLQVFGASFRLSYGIMASLLLLGLPLAHAWPERWPAFPDVPAAGLSRWQRAVASIRRRVLGAVAIGVSTLPVSLLSGVQCFGLLTPGALPANLVLIPAAGGVIMTGMGSLLCGLAGFTAGSALCNQVAGLLLGAMDAGIRRFVNVPGVHLPAAFRADWVGTAAIAAVLASLFAGYAADWRRERGGPWAPYVLTALALIFGVNFG